MLILEIMYFNPRSLTGATGGGIVAQLLEQFQSTLPRGSDADEHLLQAVLRISIHAPSRERPGAHPAPCRARHFNPRSLPGATGFGKSIPLPARISIHAPLRERRIIFFFLLPVQRISIHAPSRERRAIKISLHSFTYFNPRSLAGAT